MSRSKQNKIYLLLGIFVLCCVLTFAISRHEEQKELIKNSDEVILTLNLDTVTALSWEYENQTLAFHKEEEWLYDADETFPVDETKIYELLAQFQEFGVSFVIEEVEDYGQYSLDNPICTISISAEETYEIKLGAYSTMDEQRYVSIGDGKVYLVSHDPFEDFEIEISALIKQDEIPELSEAEEICFTGSENYTIVYEEESTDTYCKEDVYFTENKPLDSTSVSSYLSTISNLSLSDYVSYNVTEEELEKFGLKQPELTITVKYAAENEAGEAVTENFVLSIGRNQEELQAAKESKEEDAESNVTAYARVKDSPIVYRITSLSYTKLAAAGYDDLRHKEILTADFNDIYQIELSLEDAVYTLTAAEAEEETVWSYEEMEVSVSALKTALQALQAERFTEELPSQKEEIGVTVFLNNENYPKVQLSFYRYDGENCLAVVDGKSMAFVSRSEVVDLIEAVNGIVLN